jgi:hypothetical protein
MEIEKVDLSQFIGPDEFARRSGYHRATVFRWIDAGVIESKLILNARLIPLGELERILHEGSPRRSRGKK